MSVRQLLTTLDSGELAEWVAFDSLEPVGEYRADFRAGMLASLFANANKAKGAKTLSPGDFMPFIEKEEPDVHESEQSVIERFRVLAAQQEQQHGNSRQPLHQREGEN
jgi:hypothetical protein